MRRKWGVGLFLALQLGDVLTTLLLYSIYGTPLIERNPIARFFLEAAGPGGLAGLKAFGTGIIAVCWLHLPGPWRTPMLVFGNLMMASIVSWNAYLSLKGF